MIRALIVAIAFLGVGCGKEEPPAPAAAWQPETEAERIAHKSASEQLVLALEPSLSKLARAVESLALPGDAAELFTETATFADTDLIRPHTKPPGGDTLASWLPAVEWSPSGESEVIWPQRSFAILAIIKNCRSGRGKRGICPSLGGKKTTEL